MTFSISDLNKEIDKIIESDSSYEINNLRFKIDKLKSSQIGDIFNMEDFDEGSAEAKELPEKYFNFISFLFSNGYIDETYIYYKGYFRSGFLGLNDKVFIKNLSINSVSNLNLILDNPANVYKILNENNFSMRHILNMSLFKYMLFKKPYSAKENFRAILRVVLNIGYDKSSEFMSILNEFNDSELNEFIDFVFEDNKTYFFRIIDMYSKLHEENFEYKESLIPNLSSLILSKKRVLFDAYGKPGKLFLDYINENPRFLLCTTNKDDKYYYIETGRKDILIKNLELNNVKFLDLQILSEAKGGFDISILDLIISLNLYSVSVDNINLLFRVLLDKKPANLKDSISSILGNLLSYDELESDVIDSVFNNILPLSNDRLDIELVINFIESYDRKIFLDSISESNYDLICYVIENVFISNYRNIKYVINEFSRFDVDCKGKIVTIVKDYGFDKIDKDIINDNFIRFCLSECDLNTYEKLDLVGVALSDNFTNQKISEYINFIDEVAEFSSVFDGRKPQFNNDYEEYLSKKLEKYKYVSIGKNNRVYPLKRITSALCQPSSF